MAAGVSPMPGSGQRNRAAVSAGGGSPAPGHDCPGHEITRVKTFRHGSAEDPAISRSGMRLLLRDNTLHALRLCPADEEEQSRSRHSLLSGIRGSSSSAAV
jgi:hypothetical protein